MLHARRDRDFEEPLARLAALAAACLAGMAVELAFASTRGAGHRHGEEALTAPHLPLPAAGRAYFWLGTRLVPRAPAGLASLQPGDLNLGLDPLGGFFQRNLQIVAEVFAAARARAAAALAAAEEALEEILEDAAEAGLAHAAHARHGAEPVVMGALLGVGEDRVGLADLLEALLGGLVAGIAVGVMDSGEVAVGFLESGIVGVAGYDENGVSPNFSSTRSSSRWISSTPAVTAAGGSLRAACRARSKLSSTGRISRIRDSLAKRICYSRSRAARFRALSNSATARR